MDFEYIEMDSVALEAKVTELSTKLFQVLNSPAKDYRVAKALFVQLRCLCSWAKLSMLDTMITLRLADTALKGKERTWVKRGGKHALRALEDQGVIVLQKGASGLTPLSKGLIKAGMKEASAEWLAEVAPKVLRVGGRFAGPLCAVFLVKDLYSMGIAGAEKSARMTVTRQIASYGDYVDDRTNYTGSVAFLTFPAWRLEYVVKPSLKETSRFFHHFKALFPYSVPV